MIVPQWETEVAHHGGSQGNAKISRHQVEIFILKLLLDPSLPAVVDFNHAAGHDIPQVEAIHMYRAVHQLDTRKDLIYRQFRIAQVIGKAIHFLFVDLQFDSSFVS